MVYLLYKSYTSDEDRNSNKKPTAAETEAAKGQTRSKWSAQSWIRWLLFGDTPDLRGQYFGPGCIIPPQNKTEVRMYVHIGCTSLFRNKKFMLDEIV